MGELPLVEGAAASRRDAGSLVARSSRRTAPCSGQIGETFGIALPGQNVLRNSAAARHLQHDVRAGQLAGLCPSRSVRPYCVVQSAKPLSGPLSRPVGEACTASRI
jgi:hypothetical protein